MPVWFSGPRILGGLIRPGVSFGREDGLCLGRRSRRPARLSAAERRKLVDGLIEAATAPGTGRCADQSRRA